MELEDFIIKCHVIVSPNIIHIKLKIKIDYLPERRCDGINHTAGHPAKHPVKSSFRDHRGIKDKTHDSRVHNTKSALFIAGFTSHWALIT